ncbi:MAG: hypothetical protein EOS36_27920 [Mesorhizobium sp.]|uniref:hypothetical protein n=1 Tax=Mesorhizobium sp. TaxID=1871066 RepID=UPI000FE47422|nr:hypothetical protein [Mesorhizobium sp.]RWD55392.1 MAG: hypothetical protein EOS36_27920 [Mesorhizobium sp.]RWE49279.1 MAG: hypothetical protein EOS79_07635 [Mesorhizobium sp.]
MSGGGAPENEEMKDAYGKDSDQFGEHSMADAWKTGGPSFGSTDSVQQDSTTYYAFCQVCPSDGVKGGWTGPNRSVREQAQADADAHNQSRPGHEAMVYSS